MVIVRVTGFINVKNITVGPDGHLNPAVIISFMSTVLQP